MMIRYGLLLLVCLSSPSSQKTMSTVSAEQSVCSPVTQLSLVVLGNVQDAGSPQAGCKKDCCKDLFLHPDPSRKVVSLAILDPDAKKKYLLEATPDISSQLYILDRLAPWSTGTQPDGIFLSHAHIGHYTGLMYLGKEAMNAAATPVYAMPRMKTFLETNGPWSQLVNKENISLQAMADRKVIPLGKDLSIQPILVPHRDEFSETVGFLIKGPNRSAVFIPDIDKWEKWDLDIAKVISGVDYAFIDGTFYDGAEISNRNIAEIPHPFIIESIKRFENLSASEKNKIHFIHFNHTNPLLNPSSSQSKTVLQKGFHIARINEQFPL